MSGRVANCPKCGGTVTLVSSSPRCLRCQTVWLSRVDFDAEVSGVKESSAAYILDGRFEKELRQLTAEAELQMYLDVMQVINDQYDKAKAELKAERKISLHDNDVIFELQGECVGLSAVKFRLAKMMDKKREAERDGKTI